MYMRRFYSLLVFLVLLIAGTVQAQTTVFSEDFEYVGTIPFKPAGVSYHNTTQTFCPRAGSRSMYLNFINGLAPGAIAYDLTVENLCPTDSFTFSFWVRDCWSGPYSIYVDVFDGSPIPANRLYRDTITFTPTSSWFQYQRGYVAANDSCCIRIYNTWVGGTGNYDVSIDDILLVNETSPSACILSQAVLDFEVVQTLGGNAMLQWNSYVGNELDYFEAERSADGHSWQLLGIVDLPTDATNRFTYSFLDDSPNKGLNYYRVKQVLKDGTTQYTEVQSLNIVQTSTIAGFPNPVYDRINIAPDEEVEEFCFELKDLLGKIVRKGCNQLLVDVYDLPTGTYMLSFYHTNGKLITTQKIQKQ